MFASPRLISFPLIQRRQCSRCRATMKLTHRSLRDDGSEKRMFECRRCQFIETEILDDPMNAEAFAWIKGELRPPK